MRKPAPTRYADKSIEELQFIIRDANEAAQAMRTINPQAEAKYLDQINDAATEIYRRKNAKGNA
jgi:hypothetical protein